MELDDLKKQWQLTTPSTSANAIKEVIEKKISKMERSGRGIKRTFWIEMSLVWGIFAFFIVLMLFFDEHIMPFMYKIVVLIGVATTPIVWRLYKMQQRVDSIDFSMDVRSNIISFVKYYRNSLLMYEWGTYIVTVITMIMLYFDPAFMAIEANVRWTFFGYMVFVMVITRPYIHLVYGKKIAAFEDFLKD